MSRSTIALLATAALASAMLGAGCGESGEGIATATVPKSVYVKKVEGICLKTYNRVKAKFGKFTKGNPKKTFEDLDSIEEYADTVLIPERERQVREMRALGAPAGDEEEIEAILEALEAGNAEAEEDPENSVTGAYGPWIPANVLIKEYGAVDCNY